MSLLNQTINYQAIRALEKMGMEAPTQQQIDSAEQCLNESIQLMSIGVFLLGQSGNNHPSLGQIRGVLRTLYRLMEENL